MGLRVTRWVRLTLSINVIGSRLGAPIFPGKHAPCLAAPGDDLRSKVSVFLLAARRRRLPTRHARTARVAWSQALPRPSAAHSATVARVRAGVAGAGGLAVCGAWVAGNGLASVIPDARRAADALLHEDRAGAPAAQ